MEEWAKLITQVGFPIAVATFLLWRNDRTIQKNTEAIIELAHVINKLNDSLDSKIDTKRITRQFER